MQADTHTMPKLRPRPSVRGCPVVGAQLASRHSLHQVRNLPIPKVCSTAGRTVACLMQDRVLAVAVMSTIRERAGAKLSIRVRRWLA